MQCMEETDALRKKMMDASLQFRDAMSRKDRDLDQRAQEYAAAIKRDTVWTVLLGYSAEAEFCVSSSGFTSVAVRPA